VMERGFEREAIGGRPLRLGKMLQHYEPVFFVILRGPRASLSFSRCANSALP
jgi:hypothetical protein